MAMHIRVISVGRERGNEFTSLAVQDYATRIRRSAELELVELPAAAGVTSRDRLGPRLTLAPPRRLPYWPRPSPHLQRVPPYSRRW
jgi:hypothetical protein